MEDDIERRKCEHLEHALNPAVERPGPGTGFDDIHLVHDALPELALDDVDLTVNLLGRTLSAPVLITGMSGGTAPASALNRDLAHAAQLRGIAFGVGSQRVMIERPELSDMFAVRDVAPDVPLFANIGAQELARLGADGIVRLVSSIGADAVFVHLNPAQELAQRGGARSFAGCLEGIRILADTLGPRVWVKETGCGMSRHVARRLIEAGVSGLDVAGAGGTSWPRIESLRATGPLRGVGLALSGWGIPTAVSVLAVADLGVPVVASGGIRSGLDAAKAIALGATLVGVARPLLVAHRTGGREGVLEAVDALIDTLRAVLLLTGSRTVGALRQRPCAITGDLKAWTEAARSEK